MKTESSSFTRAYDLSVASSKAPPEALGPYDVNPVGASADPSASAQAPSQHSGRQRSTTPAFERRLAKLLTGGFVMGVLLMSLSTFGCNRAPSAESSTDLVALAKLVNLPGEPLTVKWQSAPLVEATRTPGPSDWGLVAILSYSPNQAERILDGLVPQSTPFYVSENLYFDWLDVAAGEHFERRSDGWYEISSRTVEPLRFYRSPLLAGFLLPLGDSNRFLLMLQTM